MSFGNNLRLVRKEKGITQEQLAEILGVSRQAISKWESDSGYPETDKLVLLSKELGVSIDFLMDNAAPDYKKEGEEIIPASVSEKTITIATHDGRQVINCLRVQYSKIMFPGKNEPPFILEAVDHFGLFGVHTVILGWYENEELVKKEMEGILSAMEDNKKTYTLQFFTGMKVSALGIVSRKQEENTSNYRRKT